LTGIVELEEKSADSDENFVSYELLMAEDEEAEEGPDPVEVLRQEQEEIKKANAEMIAAAKAEVARIEQEAYDKGFASGEETGKKIGEDSYNDQLNQAKVLITELSNERQRLNKQYEAELLPLIKTMVDRLVNHEVSVNHLVIEKCLNKALSYVVAKSSVIVHISPDDFMAIRDASLDNPDFLQGAENIELMEDPAISQGGCLLETDFGSIDATLENCREQLYQALDQSFLAALAEVD